MISFREGGSLADSFAERSSLRRHPGVIPPTLPPRPYNAHRLALTLPAPDSAPTKRPHRSAWAAPPRQLDND
jgi:hypothetical protein